MLDISGYEICIFIFSGLHRNFVEHSVFRIRKINIQVFFRNIQCMRNKLIDDILDNFLCKMKLRS